MNFSETIFLFLLALLVFGPKKLPEIARQVGKALNEFKRASNEFKAQIEAEISQLEVQERQEKWKKEQEQKLLAPTEPPAGSVESSKFSGTIVPADQASPQNDVNATAPTATNA
jgi:Tat protein translocase TatB subunit